MALSNTSRFFSGGSVLWSLGFILIFLPPANGQNSLPLPVNSPNSYQAPAGYAASGAASAASSLAPTNRLGAPVPGQPGGAQGSIPTSSAYDRLPLNPGNAIARLEELRNLMPNSRAKDFQDSIAEYCDWLSDMADAHWKLAQSFSKGEGLKTQAESERQMCFKFGQLKRQAMLLKAQFLIQQKRFPEALGPLVDIVVAEPKTETGQSAYQLLKEIGFSDEAPKEASASGQH